MSKKKTELQVIEKWAVNLDAFKDMDIGFYGMDQGKFKNPALVHPKLTYLTSWSAYNDDIPVWNLLSFLLFLYSPDSPVNKRYGITLMERKSQALMLSGFGHLRTKKGDWPADVVTYLIELRNDTVIAMIVDYLKLLNQEAWTQMKVLEQELEEAVRLRLRPVSSIDDKATLQAADIKTKLRNESAVMIEKLKYFSRVFYGDAHMEELKGKVHQMSISVESQAKQLMER